MNAPKIQRIDQDALLALGLTQSDLFRILFALQRHIYEQESLRDCVDFEGNEEAVRRYEREIEENQQLMEKLFGHRAALGDGDK